MTIERTVDKLKKNVQQLEKTVARQAAMLKAHQTSIDQALNLCRENSRRLDNSVKQGNATINDANRLKRGLDKRVSELERLARQLGGGR